jgi:hypothetical protein
MNSKNSKTRAAPKSPAKSVAPPSPRPVTPSNNNAKPGKAANLEQNIVVVPPTTTNNTAPIPKKVLKVGKDSLQIVSGKEKISSSQEIPSEKKRGKLILSNSFIGRPKTATSE